MDDRARALEQIAAIARQHGLTLAEVNAALGSAGEVPGERRGQRVLVQVLGYLGGTFVFAGIGIFIALQWSDLNSASRVLVTLGSGVAVFVLAAMAFGDPRFANASPALFLAAAALEPTGMAVAFEEYGSGGDWRWASLIISATTALQFIATFAGLRNSLALFLAILFFALFWWTALDLVALDDRLVAVVLGAGMLMAAAGADRIGRRSVSPLWYFLGGAAFLYGLFDLVDRTPLEMLFLATAAGMVYGSVVLHSRALLSVATLAILAYTAWFTSEHFVDSIGWPLALVAFGLVLIGLSALAFRIDREYVRPR